MSACGTKRTFEPLRSMSAFGGKADVEPTSPYDRRTASARLYLRRRNASNVAPMRADGLTSKRCFIEGSNMNGETKTTGLWATQIVERNVQAHRCGMVR
jgi:hypothetical protein